MLVNNNYKSAALFFALAHSASCFAIEPTDSITFSNQTSLTLATSIAGLPGNGIAPSVTKPVTLNLVMMGCSFANALENCPIEFSNKDTGEKVATVYINALTATLTQQPIFHGQFGEQFAVLGWESSPLTHISIVEKYA